MHPRQSILLVLMFLLLAALPPATPARAAPLCFPEAGPDITHCIDGRIREFWEQQGGLPVFGYPISPAIQQQSEAGPITVQWFERNRLELHPQNAPPYDVLLGRLGADALQEQDQLPAVSEEPRDGCRYFAATGRNVCQPFLQAWQSYGLELGDPGISEAESLGLFGLPLTPPQTMVLSDGQPRTVQWFERARFEDHGQQGVLLGLLGRELVDGSYTPPQVAAPPSAPPAAAPPPDVHVSVARQEGVPQEPGGFIRVSGSELVRFGHPVRIKGVNYYPQHRPWKAMWDHWDAVQMEQELRLARDTLGVNAIRVLLPYDTRGNGNVDEMLIRMVSETLQIAGDLDMRVIITLFDFHDHFPAAGTREEQRHIRYLERLIGNFAGDERIMAWDLHNEPDHYDTWKNGGAPEVLDWLGRMADQVHRLAPNHLVTVGMGQYNNLYQPGPDGRRVVDYSDVVSVHIYNPPDTQRQLEEVRRHTSKPILLQEFGWPSGPPCVIAEYNEAQQNAVYQEILQGAEGRVAGIFSWTLRDYDAGPTMRWDNREEYYGLFRPDGSLKPAAQHFAAYAASPLPSITRTNWPLTREHHHLEGEKSPKLVPESGHYVKDWFRAAWNELGGIGSFGVPLSEAYIRPSDGRVVQHFAAATLAYHPEAEYEPDFHLLPDVARTMRMIRPEPIGRTYTEGRTFPPQPPVTPGPNAVLVPETGYAIQGRFLDFYYNFMGEWRLGKPISPEVVENVGGVDVTMQYFENGRLDFNPQYNIVQVGQIGNALWAQQCHALGQPVP